MKVCKKCKREYKDEYSYCPKCGKPYDDNIKRVKTPGNVSSDTSNVLKLIWNIILYIIGGFSILGCLLTIGEDPVSSIIGILFGLSLFQFIYKIIEDKTLIDEKYLKIARVVLPIILLITIGIVYPQNPEIDNNDKKTICIYETNEKDSDGMIERVNYNAIYQNENNTHEESLTRYVFENDDLAYKYYTEHIEELKSYGNEVHLVNNIMNIYNDKKMSNEEATSSIKLHEGLGSKCKVNDNSMVEKYDSTKKDFENEKSKSSEYIENKNNTQNNSSSKQETKEETKKESSNNTSKNNYIDALRKCSVMEAADIYTTGIGKKSDNVFNDGRASCESWYQQWGEKEFISIVEEDWKNRQNEQIDGKALSYYLDILGW